LRKAEEALGVERDPRQIIDMVYIIEESATFFYRRAKNGLKLKRKQDQIDADYEKASHLASLAAPYRHPRLAAVKLAGGPSNPARISDNASADEIRAEIMRHLGILIDGGLIDLQALPQVQALSAPNRGVAIDANKATNANGGLKWIEKGGGYYSECNKRLKKL
jgi:hypothetical protein